MEELGMQAGQMPMWVNVFIGIAAALGGFEFIKWIVGLIVNDLVQRLERRLLFWHYRLDLHNER